MPPRPRTCCARGSAAVVRLPLCSTSLALSPTRTIIAAGAAVHARPAVSAFCGAPGPRLRTTLSNVNAPPVVGWHELAMTKPQPKPFPASLAVEVDAKAVCGESIRAVRIMRDRPKPTDTGEPSKSSVSVKLGSRLL